MGPVFLGGMFFSAAAVGHGTLYGTKALFREAISKGQDPILDEDEHAFLKRIVAAGTFAVAAVCTENTMGIVEAIFGEVVSAIYTLAGLILGSYVFLPRAMDLAVPKHKQKPIPTRERIEYTVVSVVSFAILAYIDK